MLSSSKGRGRNGELRVRFVGFGESEVNLERGFSRFESKLRERMDGEDK